ncbi:hypothetical protein ACFXKX_24980 [Streptomyces scopuliridis]|uniref:hypothetical protein n=1 Tax=Streptomyces scopuliridis TaxID=452529 RepID=UPI0036A85976
MAEQGLADAPDAMVRMASLRGVDAAHLVLADVDLSRCLFTGTVHLDQIRLEGTCSFDANLPAAVQGWNVAVLGAGEVGPAQPAPVYRAPRKSSADASNAEHPPPGAQRTGHPPDRHRSVLS